MVALLLSASGMLLSIAVSSGHAVAMPPSVHRFVVRREQCNQFRGEEAYDAARGRELAAKMTKFCRGTDAELARLKHRYRRNSAVRRTLGRFEATVE